MQYPNYYSHFNTGIKGHLVSSVEEVKASLIDFDGSVFYFPDMMNKKIYTKQANPDGTVSLNLYELKEMPEPTNSNDYITRQEFEKALAEISAKASDFKF